MSKNVKIGFNVLFYFKYIKRDVRGTILVAKCYKISLTSVPIAFENFTVIICQLPGEKEPLELISFILQ